MSNKRRIFAFFACLALILPLAGRTAPDPAGTWIGKMTLNDGNQSNITVVLSKEGPDYQGTISDEKGDLPANTKLESVALKGNELTFGFPVVEGGETFSLKITMKIEGDTMTGLWEAKEAGVSNAIELKRKK
jgi:hypothetical protein